MSASFCVLHIIIETIVCLLLKKKTDRTDRKIYVRSSKQPNFESIFATSRRRSPNPRKICPNLQKKLEAKKKSGKTTTQFINIVY